MSLKPEIQSEISKFPKPTPIQAVSWPYLLAGRDVIGVAETGSGKTFAFGV
ncbi:DEAD/DEAH box helicase, partial [Brenneria sp. 4F2]|nr:DEAD/DEAH box helicase [Brenneria bubanii]